MSERLAYTVAEAAELCNVSERQMRRLIADGAIYAVSMGDLRVGRVELERFLLNGPRSVTVATVLETVVTVAETVATPEPVAVRRSPSPPVRERSRARV